LLGEPVHPDNKLQIDIATARTEEYERPAALPKVEFSSLKEDLYRRDFTINAMAVEINRDNFGLFIDFFGGKRDLESGVIRVLHDKSFIDDPTRIFRAVRFEQRFGFAIEEHTEYLIQHAIKKEMFKWTENQRIREELILILKEKSPEKAVFRMRELHELRFIHPALRLRRDMAEVFRDLRALTMWFTANCRRDKPPERWIMNFMLMLDRLSPKQMDEVLAKFVFTRNESAKLRGYSDRARSAERRLSSSGRVTGPSVIYDELEGLSVESLLCLMARSSDRKFRGRVKKFLYDYRNTEIELSGDDLREIGFVPGPGFDRILRDILHRKLEKKLRSKKDEMEYARGELMRKVKSGPLGAGLRRERGRRKK
jgi:tRNA nucleotidyltransferase (CCA-adding enzyme)